MKPIFTHWLRNLEKLRLAQGLRMGARRTGLIVPSCQVAGVGATTTGRGAKASHPVFAAGASLGPTRVTKRVHYFSR